MSNPKQLHWCLIGFAAAMFFFVLSAPAQSSVIQPLIGGHGGSQFGGPLKSATRILGHGEPKEQTFASEIEA